MDTESIYERISAIESDADDENMRFLATVVKRLMDCILSDSKKLSAVVADSSVMQRELDIIKDSIRKLEADS